jgi:uncharacterized protein (DUF1015 family)
MKRGEKMADIKPFAAARPAEKLVKRVAALPYDVYSRSEARVAAAEDVLSFLNIDRPETQFPPDFDMYAPEVYAKAKELLDARMSEGTFVSDPEECYYLYELTWQGKSQTGLVACASIDDYVKGVIKKHENTREEKEIDRITHVDTCSAQTGPIFLAYRKNAVIAEITERVKETKPLYSFICEDKVRHQVWKIKSELDIMAVRESFGRINHIYIADGHHRAASAVKVGLRRRKQNPSYTGSEEFNYFLCVLFPDEELRILPYNRVVKDLNGYSVNDFLSALDEKFNITEISKSEAEPSEKFSFCMYLADTWYRLSLKEHLKMQLKEEGDPVKMLDVSVLQDMVLSPLLGITDPRTDSRIDFVGGIRGTDELERRVHKDAEVAFSMYPTSITELFAVSDAGMLMPPKSTWFEPKLRSGLFIHKI